jgi:hypothetical protein
MLKIIMCVVPRCIFSPFSRVTLLIFRIIGDLLTRHEPRPKGGRGVEVFAGCPLRCMLRPFAYRTIFVSGITGDKRPGIGFSDPASTPSI